jgi:MtN3 and saliva related transmembrane protein
MVANSPIHHKYNEKFLSLVLQKEYKTMDIAAIIGTVAAVTMILGYIPQTIKTIRTRKTDDIALGSFVLMAVGAACFFVQGVLTANVPLAVANGLTATMSTIIFVIKMTNDHRARKK